ncbi:AraC family transcriptional regulator [Paenibacillus sp. H1-7]|uniref:helix-turn-helix transcriptional regulator n=1 Tax=Paenibacillus sp. H1-7 TaxID=2282849 RepID=UPI001EF970EC|nr:AraC family transcriptional regulator [Paenibacillus sp. H1-7]
MQRVKHTGKHQVITGAAISIAVVALLGFGLAAAWRGYVYLCGAIGLLSLVLFGVQKVQKVQRPVKGEGSLDSCTVQDESLQLQQKESQLEYLNVMKWRLEHQLHSQTTVIQSYFLQRLFREGCTQSELVRRWPERKDLLEESKLLAVMALRVEAKEGDAGDKELLEFAVCNMTEELIPKGSRLGSVWIDRKLMILVASSSEDRDLFKRSITAWTMSIQAAVYTRLSLRASTGVSSLYSDIADTPTAYRECMQTSPFRDNSEEAARACFFDEQPTADYEDGQPNSKSYRRKVLNQIIAIVHDEYNSALTLESVAARLHYNSNYLSGLFNKEMRITFSEYLARHRQKMACQWLVETDMPVKEIAYKLQYTNSQNFIRSFRKRQGMTPGEYRLMHGRKPSPDSVASVTLPIRERVID